MNKIQEEVEIISRRGTDGLNLKKDIQKLAICIGSNAKEMHNIELEQKRHIDELEKEAVQLKKRIAILELFCVVVSIHLLMAFIDMVVHIVSKYSYLFQ